MILAELTTPSGGRQKAPNRTRSGSCPVTVMRSREAKVAVWVEVGVSNRKKTSGMVLHVVRSIGVVAVAVQWCDKVLMVSSSRAGQRRKCLVQT